MSHVLAISGAHVSYIMVCIIYVLKKMSINKKWAQIFTSIFLIFFIILTNFSVSVIRACISGIITLLASTAYRKKDLPTTLCIPLLLILISNPFLIKSMSLILTYGGTISIILFNNNILQVLNHISIEKIANAPEFLKKIISKLNEIISLTLSAQILIIPIIMYSYNTFSTVFLLTSILSSIVVGPIIMGGLIIIFISFISIELAQRLSLYIEVPLKLLMHICEVFSGFKYSQIYVTTPKLLYMVIYFLIVIIISYLYTVYKIKEKNNTQKRIINILYLIKYKIRCSSKKIACMCAVVFVIIIVIGNIPKKLKIYFVDVGQRGFNLNNNPL